VRKIDRQVEHLAGDRFVRLGDLGAEGIGQAAQPGRFERGFPLALGIASARPAAWPSCLACSWISVICSIVGRVMPA